MQAPPLRVIELLLIGTLAAVAPPPENPAGEDEGEQETSDVAASARVPPPFRDALTEPDTSPLNDSVDHVVERFIREQTPCGRAGSGVPCFPTGVERESEELSVEEALRARPQGEAPVPPSTPTAGEMIQYGANPHPVAANVGGGTDVPCKVKHLFKKLTGRGRTYYVYRVWDARGLRGVLREEPIAPDLFAAGGDLDYELVGTFGDECAALEAFRKIGYDARVDPPEPPGERGGEIVSPP